MVTSSLAEYEALAVELVSDPIRLQAVRDKLARQRTDAPLFDVAGYTLDLENLYDAMWLRHRSGLPPQALEARLAPRAA
jgi:predicted O-linked N-acetylglucosamine transferase (SPINDLY family)